MRFKDLMPGVLGGGPAALDEYASGMLLDLLCENIAIHAAQECGQDFWDFLS